MTTKLRFDLYKAGSGKWGYGGEVEIDSELYIWSTYFITEIILNQTDVVDGTIQTGEWYMITSNLPHIETNHCYNQLFHPHTLIEFRHVKKPICNS